MYTTFLYINVCWNTSTWKNIVTSSSWDPTGPGEPTTNSFRAWYLIVQKNASTFTFTVQIEVEMHVRLQIKWLLKLSNLNQN